jgi:RNA polymerase sigma factor (sigma-70 family)
MSESSSQDGEAISRPACQQVVRVLMAKYEWALMPEEELVDRVWAAAQTEASSPAKLEDLVRKEYGAVMHAACQQSHNPIRYQQAYQELHRFLLRTAYNYCSDLAEIVAQRALILVYEQLEDKKPRAFFGFAFNKLRQARTEELRSRHQGPKDKPLISLEDVEPDTWPAPEPSPQAILEGEESLQILMRTIQRACGERHQKTMLWKFLEGVSDEEIAARLGINAGYVRKMRYDCLERLRRDYPLRIYFDLSSRD